MLSPKANSKRFNTGKYSEAYFIYINELGAKKMVY